jgi:hypothetical protein
MNKTQLAKENAEMWALLVAYHLATVKVIHAYNEGTFEEEGDALRKLGDVCREAEPYARKHETATP